jgi:putative ABC transport system ATP-binding protein
MSKIIVGKDIAKSFGEGAEKNLALNGVSVEIERGEFVSVMGPSGSGKTTLMFALSGMDAIDCGKVLFDGKELTAQKEDDLADVRRNGMGFVFQQPTLLRNLNILDNIILPSMRDHRGQAAELAERAKRLMKKVGIEGLENRDITQVSGGQLQRAGICRALMGNPQMIFGDEPTGALNSASAQEIMDILAAINAEGTAIMLVTHDAKVAAQTGRVLFMRDGKIVDEMLMEKFFGADLEQRVFAVSDKMREIGA